MKIVLTSDTHYGFTESTNAILAEMWAHIKDEAPDVIIHAGDWASTEHRQYIGALEQFRSFFPNTPLVSATGNHDVWCGEESFSTIDDLYAAIQEAQKRFDVLTEYATDKVAIKAFNNWYRTTNPPSNDAAWMPGGRFSHHWLKSRADENFEHVVSYLSQQIDKTRIVVAHFTPFNYRYGYTAMCGALAPIDNLIEMGVDCLCLGHSHLYQNEIVKQCRVLNAGSDYDDPKYVVFNV